jgi:hypothetical protein
MVKARTVVTWDARLRPFISFRHRFDSDDLCGHGVSTVQDNAQKSNTAHPTWYRLR